MDEEVRGLRNTNMQLQSSHGDITYNIGNGVAKELIGRTQGHEHGVGIVLSSGGEVLGRGGLQGKNQDKCDCIINKIQLKI